MLVAILSAHDTLAPGALLALSTLSHGLTDHFGGESHSTPPPSNKKKRNQPGLQKEVAKLCIMLILNLVIV